MNCPLTSSCGRLFAGVSALLGLCPSMSFEGQAAMELEMIADAQENGFYEFFTERDGEKDIIRLRPLIEGVLRDLEKGAFAPIISGRFHNTLARIGTMVCQKIPAEGGPEKVALSGAR